MDISDVESAYLAGKARYEQWRVEFMREFFRPQIEKFIMMTAYKVVNTPEPQRSALKERNPQAFANLEKMVSGKKK
jgi:hypothetical protein